MSCGHVLVESVHGLCPRHLPILLVHVVGTRAGVVANPNAKVLDLRRASLVYLFIDTFVSLCPADSGKPSLSVVSWDRAAAYSYQVDGDDLAI